MANILIIDDDQDILRLLEFALTRAGHEVLIATDGKQGLAELEVEKPDLIVADVMMPSMTGYDFCKQVRGEPGTADIPIIIFSARFQPVDKQTALQAGATAYLPKSTSPDVLVKRITELLPTETGIVSNTAVGFFSLRGGTGVTSLVVNSAIALAITQKTSIAVVDLAPLGGHTALMLGLRPTSSVNRTLTASNTITLESIRPHFIKHKSGVQLLASSLNYEEQLSSGANHLEQLAPTLKSGFAFTIFDLSQIALDPQSAKVLQQLDRIILVLSPDMASLQSTALALQGLTRLGMSENKISLVVNQVVPQYPLPLKTIQKAVKRSIAAKIPFEPDMIRAVNSGQPLLLSSPKSAGAAAIARFASTILN